MASHEVQTLKSAEKEWTPPDGWQQKTAFGFMGYDSTSGGRLVRLADVLRWVGEHPNALPYAVALETFCDAMPGDVMQWLYLVQPSGGYAKPVPVDWMFGYQTAKQIEAAKVRATQERMQRDFQAERSGRFGIGWRFESGKLTSTPPQPVEPGLPALLRRIKAIWPREKFRGSPTIEHPKTAINYLAIPFDKAAQHWGWGRAPDAVIEPEEGWKLHSESGFMRCGPGAADRLVRLHDVVAWLMHSRELPLAAAVEEVCTRIAWNGLEGVHFLSGENYARPYGEPSPWDEIQPPDDAPTFAKKLRSVWLMPSHELARLVNPSGYPPEYDESKQTVFEFSGRSGSHMAKFAITFAVAHRLWAWGRVVKAHADTTQSEAATDPTGERVAALQTLRIARDDQKVPASWTELVSFRKEHPVANWTKEQKGLLVVEFQARGRTPGAKGVAADMASELSITVSRFNELKRTASQQGKRTSARQEAA